MSIQRYSLELLTSIESSAKNPKEWADESIKLHITREALEKFTEKCIQLKIIVTE
ncbi:MAG: hypothetical protein O2897_04365 [bacterium]|nr:hypothetical protein [bacterium]